MEECEKRNSNLATEVALLREQVEGLGENPVKNDEQAPKKKAAPRKQAARKPKGG
jgi:hypothetical protein